jgi:hypothetical protein
MSVQRVGAVLARTVNVKSAAFFATRSTLGLGAKHCAAKREMILHAPASNR